MTRNQAQDPRDFGDDGQTTAPAAPGPKSTSLVSNPFGAPPAIAGGAGALANVESQRGVAEVQAAMMVAQARPRNQIAAVDRILNACTRQGLAESATYSYAKGGTTITGPTIRLAEVLAQNWGNIEFGWREISRQGGQSEVLAYAWDLETNVRHPISFVVKHWRDTKKGGYVLKDEREIYELCANQAGRRLRKCLLDIIPGDIIEAALDQCELTLKQKIEITPESIKTMLDRFAEYGVDKEAIEKRIQRRVDTITSAQFISLRKIYNSMKDGVSVAADWFEIVEVEGGGDKPDAKKQSDAKKEKPQSASKKKNLESFKEDQKKEPEEVKDEATPAPEEKPDTVSVIREAIGKCKDLNAIYDLWTVDYEEELKVIAKNQPQQYAELLELYKETSRKFEEK